MKRMQKMMSRYVAMAVLACTGAAFGQGTFSAPSAPAVPTTPTAPTVPAAAQPARLLVIPLTDYNVPDSQQWIAKAVEQDMEAALGASHAFAPTPFQGQTIVEDNATAAKLARDANAAYAVRGAAQMINGTLRITAQLIDAQSGETVNSAQVTGSVNDLLSMEDHIAGQLLGNPAMASGAAITTPDGGTIRNIPPDGTGTQPLIVIAPAPAPPAYPLGSPGSALYSPYIPYDAYPLDYSGLYSSYYPSLNSGLFIFSSGGFGRDHRFNHNGGGGIVRFNNNSNFGSGSLPLVTGAGLPNLNMPAMLPIPQSSQLTFSPIRDGGRDQGGPGNAGGGSPGGGGGGSGHHGR